MEQETRELEQERNSENQVTDIWECTANECNGWMRKSFSLEQSPICPICQSEMQSGIREIPKLKKRTVKKNIFFGRGLKH